MLLRELEALARKNGYPDYRTMLFELYVVQGYSLTELAEACHLGMDRLKRHLRTYGISIRGRGGDNSSKFVLTDQLLAEVIRDGLTATAARMGVTVSILSVRVRQYYHDKVQKRSSAD